MRSRNLLIDDAGIYIREETHRRICSASYELGHSVRKLVGYFVESEPWLEQSLKGCEDLSRSKPCEAGGKKGCRRPAFFEV